MRICMYNVYKFYKIVHDNNYNNNNKLFIMPLTMVINFIK